jgi:glycopeptide antibiotics resistance protein
MKKITQAPAWLWLIILVGFNVIPLGNAANSTLSGNKAFSFRLDYLLHTIMILIFGWIWLFVKTRQASFFAQRERLNFALIVLSAGIGLELLQLLVPWRSFNPVDMYYNLFGAGLSLLIVALTG